MSGSTNHTRVLSVVRVATSLALFEVALEYSITRVFVLNFSTAGPNVTALLALALVTGWTLPVSARWSPALSERVWLLFVGGGTVLSFTHTPVVAFAGTVLVMLGLTPLLAADTGRLGRQSGVALGLGLLVVLAVRAWNGAVPPYATLSGRTAVLAGAASLGLLTLRGERSEPSDIGSSRRFLPAIAAVYLAVLWLGAPAVPARWSGVPYTDTVLASVVGLTAGLWLTARGTVGTALQLAATAGVLFVGTAVTLLDGPLAVAGTGVAVATLPLLVGSEVAAETQTGARRLGGATALVQAVGVVLLAGFIFAVNFAFVPGGGLLEGTTPVFVLGLAGLVGVTSVAATAGADTGSAPDCRASGVTIDRRTVLGGAGLGTAAAVGAVARAPPSETSATVNGNPRAQFRAVTYNLHQYFDTDGAYNLAAVADLLRGQAPDVVGLQETTGARLTSGNAHGVRWLADELAYRHRAGPAAETGGYGVALLSKWPLRDTVVTELPRREGAVRVALRATVDHPTGPVPVAVTHLETAGTVRSAQARQVRSLLSDATVAVVLGDCNATPNERPVGIMTEQFTDAWAAVNDRAGPTFSAADPTRRIDYVFHRGFHTDEAHVFGTASTSDHLGVCATLDRADDTV